MARKPCRGDGGVGAGVCSHIWRAARLCTQGIEHSHSGLHLGMQLALVHRRECPMPAHISKK